MEKKKVASKAMKVWRQGFEPPRNGEKLRFSFRPESREKATEKAPRV